MLNSISTNRFKLDNDLYAWFFFGGIAGGADAYFWHFDDIYTGFLRDEIE